MPPRTLIAAGGGVESALAIAYARDNGLNPIVVTEEIANILAVKKMTEAVQKQCDFFGVECHVLKNDVPMKNLNVPAGDWLIDVCVKFILGNPQYRWTHVIGPGMSEDCMQQRVQFKYVQRVVAARWSNNFELSGIDWNHYTKMPQFLFPNEYLTKAEVVAILFNKYPEVMKMIWTCVDPTKEGKPCLKCHKCVEYRAAKDAAKRARRRVQEGVKLDDNLRG